MPKGNTTPENCIPEFMDESDFKGVGSEVIFQAEWLTPEELELLLDWAKERFGREVTVQMLHYTCIREFVRSGAPVETIANSIRRSVQWQED